MVSCGEKVTIYALVDPRDQRCRYVGKTKHAVVKRLRGHLSDARRRGGRIRRFRWINDLVALGMQPTAIVLEQVHANDWQAGEQMWVAEMRARFPDLLNATAGGDGIHEHQHTAETRARMSVSAKARYAKRPPKLPKIRRSTKGRVVSPEWRAKISASKMGQPRSEASRLKQAETRRGKKHSEDTKQKIRAAALKRYAR